MKKDSRAVTLRVLIFNYARAHASPPKFKTLIGGFEAVSICEDTGKLIDVFDVATHDTDIFTRLCDWLNQQGGDSPIHAVIKNTGDPILDCDDYSQSWRNIMAQLADFPTRELIAHQGLKPHDDTETPEERARAMLAEVTLRQTLDHSLEREL